MLAVNLSSSIETDRLLLRLVREDDLPALIKLKTDPEVARYLPYPAAPTPGDVEMALHAELDLAASSDDTLLWGIQRRDDPGLIGHVSIWPRWADVPRGELIILVARTHWHQGVAFEACTAAMARWLSRFEGSTIYAAVHPENLACQGLMRKLGLDHEIDGGSFPGLHSETDRVFWKPSE